MKRFNIGATAVAAIATLAACGGGGSTPPVTQSQPQANATVQFSVTVPVNAPASAVRRPQFSAPSGTQSISISLNSVNGAAPSAAQSAVVLNLSASTPGCTTANNQLTCVVSVTTLSGTDVFSVTTYAQPNAAGTPTGSGNVSVQASANQTTQAPTTLSGTIASLSISTGIAAAGSAGSVPLVLVAKDASGNAIIGTYNTAVTLSDSDASNQTQLSATTVSDSTAAAALTIAYKGGAMAQAATISASATGAAATTASFAPSKIYPTTNGTTYTTQDVGYGNTTYFDGSTPRPMPTATTATTHTVTTNATFGGVTGLVDTKMTNAAGTTDAYGLWVPGTATAAFDYVGSVNTWNGGSYTNTCVAPFGPMIVEPFPASWDALTGTGACTYDTVNTFGATATDELKGTANADGSYTSVETYVDTATPANNSVTSYAVLADATATITYNSTLGSNIVHLAPPQPGAATIAATVQTFPGAIPSPSATTTPAPVATTAPNIYTDAGLTKVPSPLQSDVMTNKGTVTSLPASCPVSPSILGTAPLTEVDEAYTYTDPTFIVQTGTFAHYFVAGVGEVCVNDTIVSTSFYYDGIAYPGTGRVAKATHTNVHYLTAKSVAQSFRTQGFKEALSGASATLQILGTERSALLTEAARARATARAKGIAGAL